MACMQAAWSCARSLFGASAFTQLAISSRDGILHKNSARIGSRVPAQWHGRLPSAQPGRAVTKEAASVVAQRKKASNSELRNHKLATTGKS
jgi:hypothetical protein